jgi:hypothetical protein
MLNQLIRNCLAVAVACSIGAPVIAADISVDINGRTRAWLENVAVKDGTKTMQFKADGRLGAGVSAKSGSWTVTAFQNFDIDSDAGGNTPTIREQNIMLSDQTLDITLGRLSPYGITKGMKYAVGPLAGSYWVGETVLSDDVADHLVVGVKDIGLKLILGLNHYDTTTVGDARDETLLGAVFGRTSGPLDLSVEYLTANTKIDGNDGDAVKDGVYDGQTFNALALSAAYSISKKMSVALNLENNTKRDGNAGAEENKNAIIELWFDMGLSDTSGISIGYGTKSTDDGSVNKTNRTMINLAYAKTVGIADLYANYVATTEKDDDLTGGAKTDNAATTIGAGILVNF